MATPSAPVGMIYPGTQQPHAQGGYVVATNTLGQRDALYPITQPVYAHNYHPIPYPPNSQLHGPVYPGAATAAGNVVSAPTTATAGQSQVIRLAPAQRRHFSLSTVNQMVLRCLGSTLFILGVLSFVFNVILDIICDPFTFLRYFSPGIWCGVLIMITGAFGVYGAIRKSKPLLITFLVLTIFTAVCCLSAYLVIAAIGVAIDTGRASRSVIFCGVVLIGNAFIAGVVAIVGSGMSCGVLCCRGGRRESVQYVALEGGPQY